MNLDNKKSLDLFYSFSGIIFYYFKKGCKRININLNGINSFSGITSKSQIKTGLLYKRKINYFDVDLSSSGTTGEPTTVWANPLHWISEQSAQYEYFTENGYQFRDRMIILRGYAPKKGEPIFKVDKIRNFIWISAFDLNKSNIDIIKSFFVGKYFLRGYPSSIELLSRLLYDEGISSKPRAIFTASETLTTQQRDIIKKVFNKDVYDWYGTSEPSIIMFQTKESFPVYKLPMFHCNVKLEDSHKINEKQLYGQSIWYNLSDFGYYKTNDVALVNNFNEVIGIVGRESDFIELGNKIIPLTNLLTVLYSVPGIFKFQIINQINLNVKFILNVDKYFRANNLTIELDKRLGDGNYIIEYNTDFVTSNLGKTPFFVKI